MEPHEDLLMLSQALLTLAHDNTSSLGHQAKAYLLAHVTAEDLYKVYHYFQTLSLTGWDLALMSGDVDLLTHILPMAQDPIKLTKPFPKLTNDTAPLIISIWLQLNNTSPTKGLVPVLTKHTLNEKTASLVLDHLESRKPTIESLDQLAVWRLQDRLSKKTAKRVDAYFTHIAATTAYLEPLAERLIIQRRCTQAIAWIISIGNGNGMNFAIPNSVKVNALHNNALRALSTNHGRISLIAAVSGHGFLHTAQDMNAALKLGISS